MTSFSLDFLEDSFAGAANKTQLALVYVSISNHISLKAILIKFEWFMSIALSTHWSFLLMSRYSVQWRSQWLQRDFSGTSLCRNQQSQVEDVCINENYWRNLYLLNSVGSRQGSIQMWLMVCQRAQAFRAGKMGACAWKASPLLWWHWLLAREDWRLCLG